MNGRRSFIKGFGLFSAVLAGGAAARSANAASVLGGSDLHNDHIAAPSETVDPAVIRQLEEQHTSSLALKQTYGEIAPPPPPPKEAMRITSDGALCFVGSTVASSVLTLNPSGGVCIGGNQKQFVPGTEKQVDVKMVPGPDGELYLKVNGQWKKVLTA
jgi:hypothetical protein